MHFSKFPVDPCPNCGANGDYRTWGELTGGNGIYRGPLRIKTADHPLLGSRIEGLICGQCGNVQFFVDPGNLKRKEKA